MRGPYTLYLCIHHCLYLDPVQRILRGIPPIYTEALYPTIALDHFVLAFEFFFNKVNSAGVNAPPETTPKDQEFFIIIIPR